MGNKTISLWVWIVLVLSTSAFAKHNSLRKIPFKLYRDHLVIASGRLGSIANRNLLIDTGAYPTVVDEALAHELRLQPLGRPADGMTVIGGVAQIYYAVLQGLDFGPVHRDSLVVAVANLSFMQASVGIRVDAIVGLDAVAPNNFQIDYESQRLVFGTVHTPASAVPMLPNPHFAIVETEIDGAPVPLAVDTGASQLALFRNGLPRAITFRQLPTTVQLSNVAGDLLAQEIHLTDFKIGSEDLGGSTAVLTTIPNCCEFQGVLGISAQAFKRVTFDFQRQLLGLELADDPASLRPFSDGCSGVSCQQKIAHGFVSTPR